MDDLSEILCDLEKSFNTGKRPWAVLTAVHLSIRSGIKAPEWARRELDRIMDRAFIGELKSWDDAFGRPPTRGSFERFVKFSKAIVGADRMIAEARERGEPIDDRLFDKIGRALGVGGKTSVKKAYRALKLFRELERQRQKSP